MTPSAAEKAEQRRQKILAKKKARMAYVAGNSTEPPSSVEPSQPEIVNAEHHEPSGVALSNATTRTPLADETVLVDPGSLTPLPASDPFPAVQQIANPFQSPLTSVHDYPGALPTTATRQQRNWYAPSLIVMAVAFAVGNKFHYISDWPVSAVELFIYTRLFLEIPRWFVGKARFNVNPSFDPYANRSTISTFLDIANNVSSSLSLAQQLWTQFSTYMFVFLLTWYYLQ